MTNNVIIDYGSFNVKYGMHSDYDNPKTIRSVLGKPKLKSTAISNFKDRYGDEVMTSLVAYSAQSPIRYGTVQNFEYWEKLLRHILEKCMHIEPEEHLFLMSGASSYPRETKEKIVQYMFEDFCVPGMFLAVSNVLSMISKGILTGIGMECGLDTCSFVPVYEGYCVQHCQKTLDIGGSHIDDYLGTLLIYDGYKPFQSASERQHLRRIKEQCCFCMGTDEQLQGNREYELPDGNLVKVSVDSASTAPEILFKPKLNGNGEFGIHYMLSDTIRMCDIDIRKICRQNIYVSGGTSLLPGFANRLKQKTEKKLNVKDLGIKVDMSNHAVFNGGCIMASIGTFNDSVITREMYEEMGPGVVHRVCW